MFSGTVTVRYVWFILLYYIAQTLSFHCITRTISHNQAKESYNCHAAQRIPLSLFCLCLSLDFSLFSFVSLRRCLFCLYLCMSVFLCLLYLLLFHSLFLCLSIFVSLPFSFVSFSVCLCLFVSVFLLSLFLSDSLFYVSLCLSLSLP